MSHVEQAVSAFVFEMGEPEHGWMRVTVRADAQELQFDASDMHPYSLIQLCEGTEALLHGAETATVEWELEPVLCTFQMRSAAAGVLFEALFWDELRLKAVVPAALFVPAIIQALEGLRRLHQRGAFQGEELWEHPFPEQDYRRLLEAVQQREPGG